MRITVLVENTANNENFETEHGLSLYIETENKKILFDMGQGDLFAKNADKLGIDLKCVDIAVLSHGHYDHGGGLSEFLSRNDKATVFVNKGAFLPYYNGKHKYIGLDGELENHPRVTLVDDEYRISDELILLSCNDKTRKVDFGCFGLSKRIGDEFLPDDFTHEQYLLINDKGRNILISGCSHKGILNIAEWFSPYALVGGFHFSKIPLDDGRLLSAARELDRYQTEFYTCHCTGEEQYEFMRRYMKRLNYIRCGDTVVI